MSSIIIKNVEIHILLVKGPFLRSGHNFWFGQKVPKGLDALPFHS